MKLIKAGFFGAFLLVSTLLPWFVARLFLYSIKEYKKTKEYERKKQWGGKKFALKHFVQPETIFYFYKTILKKKFFKCLFPFEKILVENDDIIICEELLSQVYVSQT